MIIEANWGNFGAKFNGREEKAFEWLCSLLFYKEHGHPTGSLRYFNQPGIEAEPICVGDEVIGFQAKFISSGIETYKAKLISAIDTAKSRNPKLTRIYFYINQEFGESTKGRIKDPTYKREIDEHAKALGIAITWRTTSFFQSPFVCETNSNIAQHFFSLDPSVMDFVEAIARHTAAIMDPIRSEIILKGKPLKIDRGAVLARLKEVLSTSALAIVSGEGGVGKTAIVKELYGEIKATAPFFVFKAAEFNVTHISQVFREYGNFTFDDFVREHAEFEQKYIVIDSAEKLSDLEHREIFQDFISVLRAGHWKIVFTTRLGYLDDLKYAVIELYRAPFEPLNVPGLIEAQLVELSTAQNFLLPPSTRLRRILQNPFYLNEYLGVDPEGNISETCSEFREAIWNRQIAKSSYQKNNAHRKREECFLEIARRRAASGNFFVTMEGYGEALQGLESDEIIKFDSKARGYFIAHDIYEEWALERIIEQAYSFLIAYGGFYQTIGDSLPMRRAFRGWVSAKLAEAHGDAARLIENTLHDQGIPRHWKDEAVVAALLSDYSSTFVQIFEKQLLAPVSGPSREERDTSGPAAADSLLYRALFLLRIACKEVDQNLLRMLEGSEKADDFRLSSLVTRPKGSGWHSLIGFIHQHKEQLGLTYLPVALPVLDDWTQYNKAGEATKAAGQIALHLFHESTEDGGFGRSSEVGEQLIRVIFAAAAEIKPELTNIFAGVIARKEIDHMGRYHELATTALSSINKSSDVAQALPKEVLALAGLFWPYTPPKRVEGYWGSNYRNDIERYFNLATDHFDHHPASAYHTPIWRLLPAAPQETCDFILKFVNRAIEHYATTDMGMREVEEIEIVVDGAATPVKQYASDRLWQMYRGTSVGPALLQSIHMSLEKWLLAVAKSASAPVIESWCRYLLKHSKSASITAIVASVVVSQSSKLFGIARLLLRTKELFLLDLARMQHDQSASGLYGMGFDRTGLFQNERLKTCDDKHRKWSLENLALQYQMFRSEEVDEGEAERRQQEVWAILDEHYARLPDPSKEAHADKVWRLSLARMDRRKMKISVETKDDQVVLAFDAQMDPKLKEYQESELARSTAGTRHLALSLWARYRWEGKATDYVRYPQYETDPSSAATETKEVWDGLNSSTPSDDFRLFYRSLPASACAVFLRDFADKLDESQRVFCRDVVLWYACLPLRGPYDYQIGDGLDAAIGALPIIFQLFEDTRPDVKQLLLFLLFDSHPVGMNERFSDYAVAALIDRLWTLSPQDANSIFLGYLVLQPKYRELCNTVLVENRDTDGASRYYYAEVMQRFDTEQAALIEKVEADEVTAQDIAPVEELEDDALVTGLSLLPRGTTSAHHKALIIDVTSKLMKKQGRRGRRDEESLDFNVRHRFLRKFAYLVLSAPLVDLPDYLRPMVEAFSALEYEDDIFQEFVNAEDALNSYDAFWLVWEAFYPQVVLICDQMRGSYRSNMVHNYLLAWPYWRKGANSWHTLRERERGFFARVAQDMGSNPAVLYSLAKFLNEIGAGFASDGVFWLSGMIKRGIKTSRDGLEDGTVYYLENFVRSFVLRNRQTVRTTPQTREAVLQILNFLLEKGSVTAYLVREDIL